MNNTSNRESAESWKNKLTGIGPDKNKTWFEILIEFDK